MLLTLSASLVAGSNDRTWIELDVPGSWILLDVTATARTEISLRIDPTGSAAALAALWIDGEVVSANVGWGNDGGLTFQARESQQPIDLELRRSLILQEILQPPTGTAQTLFAGERGLVLLAGFGELSATSYHIDPSTADVTIVGEGPTFATDGSELESGVWTQASLAGANAHLAVNNTLEFNIAHTLIGWFAQGRAFGYAAHESATLLREGVVVDTCPCVIMESTGPNAHDQGKYTLEWDSIGGGIEHSPLHVWADVPFPDI